MDDFLRPLSVAFVDELTDAAVRLMADAGTPRLSIGVVAAGVGMRRQSLTDRLHSQAELWSLEGSPVAILHQVVAIRFGRRWREWATDGLHGCSPIRTPRPAIPRTEAERRAVRIWHGLRQMASADLLSGEPGPAEAIAEVREWERDALRIALGSYLGRPAEPLVLAEVEALADGLRLAVAEQVDPLAAPAARRILRGHIRGLRGTASQARRRSA